MHKIRQWDKVTVCPGRNANQTVVAVVVSPTELTTGPIAMVNVVLEVRRSAEGILPGQVELLADETGNASVFDCALLPCVSKESIKVVVGSLSADNRAALQRTIASALRLFH
jgi:hypothetical protein